MHIRIDHMTRYAYERPVRTIIQTLRLTPRSSEAQQVRRWGIETDVDTRLKQSEDAFGNIVHTLYTEAPTDRLTVRVSGDVTTTDTQGVLSPQPERLSPLVYLRDTPLTAADAAIRALAAEQAVHAPLERLHRLMSAVLDRVQFQVGATTSRHTAADVLALGQGVCQDHAHLFIACARATGIPARYVSGHLVRADGRHEQDAAHAWAEAWVEDLGWVGFDAANGVCPTDAYVRVAVGLDYLGAAPVRGSTLGGGRETLNVQLDVRDVERAQQSQNQA